jgi:hypothetical protein
VADEFPNIPWNLICERIHNQECTFFLGAGVNGGRATGGLPMGSEVAFGLLREELGDEASKALKRILGLKARLSNSHSLGALCQLAAEDFAKVAQYVELRNDKPHVVAQLAKLIPDHLSAPSEVLLDLAKLVQPDLSNEGGIKTIISTNYDCHFERALGLKYVKLIHQPCGGYSSEQSQQINDEIAKSEPPIFYKMHGSFPKASDDKTRLSALSSCSIVASEDDYVEFITAMNTENRGVPLMIKDRLSTSTIIFLAIV